MKSLILFTLAMVAWVSYEASATEPSCALGFKGSIFQPHQHRALIGHSFLNQSGTTIRIKCMMLCFRHSRCLSFNHDDSSGICQLNDARKHDFPGSIKQDLYFSYFESSHKAKPLVRKTTMATKTEQETPRAQATTAEVSKGSTELSTETTEMKSTKAVDTESPTLECPEGVFGLTNDSNAPTSVQWNYLYAFDDVDGFISSQEIQCRDDGEGRFVVPGDFFKVGNTSVTCTTSDVAGNSVQCTFVINVTVCNITPLGMESGAIADHQISAKNVLNNDTINYGPALARLNSDGSWCGEPVTDTWIQVDFGRILDIYGLIMQGRYQSEDRVTSFKLAYSIDGGRLIYSRQAATHHLWFYYSYWISGRREVLVSVQTTALNVIRARVIRITPINEEGKICMRFELLTCS